MGSLDKDVLGEQVIPTPRVTIWLQAQESHSIDPLFLQVMSGCLVKAGVIKSMLEGQGGSVTRDKLRRRAESVIGNEGTYTRWLEKGEGRPYISSQAVANSCE